MRMFWSILSILVVGYLAMASLVYFNQAAYVYFPTRILVGEPRDLGMNYENVHLVSADGIDLHGWFIAAPAAKSTLLFFHGNGGNISHRLETLQIFHELGFSTFIIDYRGYGRSNGQPSEQGTYQDARTAWNYLTNQRGLDAKQIVVVGRSLGGAIAAQLATEINPGGLILESTFTSIPALGAKLYPWLPVSLLARIEYNTLEKLPAISSPILIAHSLDDNLVPYSEGARLYANVQGPKTLLQLSGGHNNTYTQSEKIYRQGLASFMKNLKTETAGKPDRSGVQLKEFRKVQIVRSGESTHIVEGYRLQNK